MVDYSTPNDEAIKSLGLLDRFDGDHYPGWAFDTMVRMREDFADNYADNEYTLYETNIWIYYRDHILPQDKWEKLVENPAPDPGDYDPERHYTDKPPIDFEPPTGVYGRSGDRGEVVISSAAIEYFCRQIESITEDGSLTQAVRKLSVLDIKPGTFGHAVALREVITGPSGSTTNYGLKGDTIGFLNAVDQALVGLARNLRAMLREYESAEDLNKLTAATFDNAMRDTWSKIGMFKDYGNSSSGVPGGSTGGDGDDEGTTDQP
ncbi:hypothetical protein ABUL04_17680 [Micromonospora harpali]|uniref:Uncharacterized protein n=1 Tax=Micromonospora harpali TaxID=1490225 RepID=A0ABW1HYH4_9ACTN